MRSSMYYVCIIATGFLLHSPLFVVPITVCGIAKRWNILETQRWWLVFNSFSSPTLIDQGQIPIVGTVFQFYITVNHNGRPRRART